MEMAVMFINRMVCSNKRSFYLAVPWMVNQKNYNKILENVNSFRRKK